MVERKRKSKQAEFLKWFEPILEALRQLGGAGKAKEVIDQIAKNLKIPDNTLEETLNQELFVSRIRLHGQDNI